MPSPAKESSDNAVQVSSMATTIPITGVQRPRSRKMAPADAIRLCAMAIGSEGFPESAASPKYSRAIARQTRSSSRPNPGRLFGKVENRRCRMHPNSIVWSSHPVQHPRTSSSVSLFRGMLCKLQIDDSAP